MICLIYFSMAQFNDNIKFRWRNLKIKDLVLINLHILLITKRFFRSFDRHSDKTVTSANYWKTSTISVIKLWMSSESLMSLASKLYELLRQSSRIPLIFLWMPAYDVRALPADTRRRHDFPPSCCWVDLPIFYTPWLHM